MSNELFISANGSFDAVQNINKEQGLGVIKSCPPIHDCDFKKITYYFNQHMELLSDPKNLQETIIFYSLFYMCHHGRENLRPMVKQTFTITTDPEVNKRYIYHTIDEADKNHCHHDTKLVNQGRIYEITGEICNNCQKLK